MNVFRTGLVLVAALVTLASCESVQFKRPSAGNLSEVLVVIDSLKYTGPVAQALHATFGAPIETMPRPEPRYDLIFRTLHRNADIEVVQKHRNLILVSHLTDSSNVGLYVNALLSEDLKARVRSGEQMAFFLRDHWYTDQWVLILMGPDEQTLAQRIRENGEAFVASLDAVEWPRWDYDVYRRGDQPAKSDSLMQAHGWTFRVQHDYYLGIDTLDFVTLRRYLEDNDRWIWVHWMENVETIEGINADWINRMRDSLNQQYFRGTREDAYIETDYRRPHRTEFTEVNGRNTFITKGIWVMSDRSMGGPFINYTFHDPQTNRLYLMEFGQFSPKYKQRRFLYQFEAIARTFRTAAQAEPAP